MEEIQVKKKFVIIIIRVFLFLSVLINCDKGNPGQVNLKIFISQPRFREQSTSYFDKFMKKYKKGIEVTHNLEMPTADTAAQMLRTKFASGGGLYIFSCHAINELPEFIKAGYVGNLSSQPFVDKLYATIKHVITVDGKVRVSPLESLFWGIVYNKKICNELNINPALTVSELKENIAKIKSAGYIPFLLAYKDQWVPQLLPLIVGGFVNSGYPDFIKKMNDNEGSFTDLEGFSTIIDLVNANGNPRALDIDANRGNVEFASGKYAMYGQGPWMAQGFLDQDEDFDFGVAPLPVNDNPETARINIAVSTCLGVNSKSKNKDTAVALINYILDDTNSNAFYQSMKFNPRCSGPNITWNGQKFCRQ
jgi:raffinose/stachyose/melibiose transport system substrate-binding protein